MKRLTLVVLLVMTGCMPYHPSPSKVTTAPLPTIKGPAAVMSKPLEVLEKAIAARGGEAALKKLSAVSYRGKGISAPGGVISPFVFRTTSALPDRIRDEQDYQDGTRFVQVFNKEKGWLAINGKVKEINSDPAAIKSLKDLLYANQVLTLLPLKDKAYTLEPLPEQRKEGVMTQGFVVKQKDQPDISLFFDKETGELLLSKSRVIDPNALVERDQETLYTQYKTVQGIPFPMRWVIYNDGNKSMELSFEELKFLDKVDEILFAKP
ncbi:MAG: hypothetical protein U0796_06390 [Gemmatales bacterium]